MTDCNHRWLSTGGTNDYECYWCGSRKGDTGSIYPARALDRERQRPAKPSE